MDIVSKQIWEWIDTDIVRLSISEYASPVVLVKKRNASMRLCVDYRKINDKIVKDPYPLPLIKNQLDMLQEAKYFSTLDFRNGVFHVVVQESSRKYIYFIVSDGQYEFLRAPFGLCNSPSVFERCNNVVFRNLIREIVVLTYFDDIIIPSDDEYSGIIKFKIILTVASKAGLEINWDKCHFLQPEVEFSGHVVSNKKIRPSEHKTNAVRKFPEPTTIRQIQSFLVLTGGYFRKFVLHYSVIARLLTEILKMNNTFKFGDQERDTYIMLKKILYEKHVLCLYKVNCETELYAY